MGTRRVAIGAAVAVAILSMLVLLFVRAQRDSKLRVAVLETLPELPIQAAENPQFLRQYRETLKTIESGSDPLVGMAKITRMYQANGYIAEAIQCLARLVDWEPKNPRWPYFLGYNLAGYGELDDAIELWERAAGLSPEYAAVRIRQAEAFIKLNRLDEAEASAAQALSLDERDPHALQVLARIEMINGRDNKALPLLRKAMAFSNDRVGVQLLVTVFDNLGMIREANAIRSTAQALEQYAPIPDVWLDELLDDCYDSNLLLTGGGLAMYAGNPERGIELLLRLISYEPENATAYHQLGVIYRDMRDWRQAVASFDRATQLDPSLSDSWLFQAVILRDLGQVVEGNRKLREGLAANPASPALHLLQGQVLAGRNQFALAKKYFRKSIELRPQEAEAYNELGRLYLLEGNIPRAKETILASLDAETANPVALSLMVLISIQADDRSQALHWYEQVLKQPRILPAERRQLRQFIQKRFG